MRAKLYACSAVAADQRRPFVFVEANGVHCACVFTSAAPNALVRVQQNATSLAQGKRVCGANLSAVWLSACLAYGCNESPRQATAGLDMDTALADGVVSAVHRRAGQHTGKAPYAFIYFVCPDNPCQKSFPLLCVRT